MSMDRRSILGAAAIAGLALMTEDVTAQPRATQREVYELRSYRLVNGPMRERLDTYLRDAFIPAARRAGSGPVGVFTVTIGPDAPSLYVLVPHPTIADFVAMPGRLTSDAAYLRAAASFLRATPADPPYASLEIKLMQAFPHVPHIEVPGQSARIFELRTYHSHAETAGATKIDMFDTGGELEIFRRTGLAPVFFAQDLTGVRLPSLTYMLTFPDMPTRERAWRTFGSDPAWKKLIATPGLTDPEITTGIDNRILSPTPYSQI